MQIAAARAHHENNRVSVAGFVHRETRARLTEIRDTLGLKDMCGPCWIHNEDPKHLPDACDKVALGWSVSGSAYKRWIGTVSFPEKHCYDCGLPQVLASDRNA
jgi:hypothetical protein